MPPVDHDPNASPTPAEFRELSVSRPARSSSPAAPTVIHLGSGEPPLAWMAGLGLVAIGLLAPGTSLAEPAATAGPVQADPPITGPGITQTLPITPPAYATSDSNGRMIAVTGVDVTGSSVLYLVDTVGQQLACYQATGGGSATNGLKLIGARKIDLDLQLVGFNDKSEVSYEDLERSFARLGQGETDD